ncbi:hypothetical protein AXF42_Ash017822 [Apostasia shenzhenica]|uniref:Uncharacterized protein n=1 Tax=Apostasia shenzhenica TaxID=1088818 RepID=A0A2I0A3V4_9ASPA|nr:hypothetical protein AXF42_Ash017822 [Apostasia shenzhenica]
MGWFRLRQIGNKRVPHDRPGPSRLPAKRSAPDDPEELQGRREGETGLDAEASDSTGPGVECGGGIQGEHPGVVPEGRLNSVTRIGARAADSLDVVRRQVE